MYICIQKNGIYVFQTGQNAFPVNQQKKTGGKKEEEEIFANLQILSAYLILFQQLDICPNIKGGRDGSLWTHCCGLVGLLLNY